MKCARCQARNAYGAIACYACGVRLKRPGWRPRPTFRPDALRYFSATAAADHKVWLDGLVLISTVFFGLLLAYFALDVLPASAGGSGTKSRVFALRSPLSLFTPAPKLLAVQPIGQADEAQRVVAQVVEPRRTRSEGGRQASAGTEFLTVTVVIDNQGKQPLAYSLEDWQVRDSKGRASPAESIKGAGWLSGGTVEPGKHVQAQVTFLLPEGEASPQVTFGPAPLHAVMRWDASAPAVQ